MRNVIICGIGRAGKTTLSNMLKDRIKTLNLIHSDSIKWGIIIGKDKEKFYTENIEAQKEFEHSEEFQKIILEIFNNCIYDYENKYGYILESGQLDPRIIHEIIDYKDTLVIALGHGSLTKQDIIELCRKNDTPKDWKYEISDDELEKHAQKWADMNDTLEEECKKYNIKYIDTSKNRMEVLNKTLEYIVEEIENEKCDEKVI